MSLADATNPLAPAARTPAPRGPAGTTAWLGISIAIAIGVLAPVGGLIYFATRSGSDSLWPHLVANVIPASLWTTILLLAGVGAFVAFVGVGAAWLVTMFQFPGRRLFEWALLLPLSVPTYIVAYAYLDLTHPTGPVQTWLRTLFGIVNPRDLWFPEVRSLGGCIFILGTVLYPYVYLPTRAVFAMESGAILTAGRGLGAGPLALLWRVALPLSRPAVAAGTSLALLETLNDIGATTFLGVNSLTVAIYTTWLARSSIEGAAQIALVLLAVTSCLMAIERAARRSHPHAGASQVRDRPVPRPLSGIAALAASLACALPLILGFAIPTVHLVVQAAQRADTVGFPAALPGWVLNSVTAAVPASVAIVGLGLALAYTLRLSRSPLAVLAVRLAGVGYAIPGTVLAVGLLVPLVTFENLVDDWAREALGMSTGLFLTGSGAALVVAYGIRFLAVTSGSTEAGLAKIDGAMDMSARGLGAGPLRLLARIHVPLLRPALLAGALLVFVDCMKELPATLLLRPFDFETLATHVYAEAARGVYEDGALAALAIVAVSLVPVVVLSWASGGGKGGS